MLSSEKSHLKRIMSIWSHSKRKFLYTIGEDGMLKVYDLKAKAVTQEVTVSANKLTYMLCDPSTGFGFISDKAGMIKLYDMNSVRKNHKFWLTLRIHRGRDKLLTCRPSRLSEEWMLILKRAGFT